MHMYLFEHMNEYYHCFNMSTHNYFFDQNKYLLNKTVFKHYAKQVFQEISFKLSGQIQSPLTTT